jgi:hypothetical protein
MRRGPRRLLGLLAFWIAAGAFVATDLWRAPARDRFAEPPALALGSARAAGAGHCSGAPGR